MKHDSERAINASGPLSAASSSARATAGRWATSPPI